MSNLPTEIPDVIRARRVEIIDRAGRTRITLGFAAGEQIAELSILHPNDEAGVTLGVGYENDFLERWPVTILQLSDGDRIFELTERGIDQPARTKPARSDQSAGDERVSGTAGTVGDLLADSVVRDERQALAQALHERVDELIPALVEAVGHLAVVEAAGDLFDIQGAQARALLHSCAGTDGMVEAFGRLARVLAGLPAGPACEIEAAVAADR